MTLATFAAVWIATWAACWFVGPKWWPSRRTEVSIINPDGVYLTRGVMSRERHDPNGNVSVMIYREWWRLSGSREWSPILATAVAFLVNWIVA